MPDTNFPWKKTIDVVETIKKLVADSSYDLATPQTYGEFRALALMAAQELDGILESVSPTGCPCLKARRWTNDMRNTHQNDIVLYGRLCENLTATTHVEHGVLFNGFVSVRRDSGAEDVLPIGFHARAAGGDPYRYRGQMVRVVGEMRSYNRNDAEVGHRHRVTVWASDIRPTGENYGQSVRMEGVICKPPMYRVTPFGREVCDLMIAVDQHHRESYIPVICWGMTARRMVNAQVGDLVELQGRFQSRQYEKTLDAYTEKDGPVRVTRTAYEVSAKTCHVIGVVHRRLMAE